MDTFLGIVLLWVAISLPFLFLAHAIFLVRENRKFHYSSVYVKAAISFGIFLLICFVYYILPGFFKPASIDMPNGKEAGLFVNRKTGDTFELKYNSMTIRHGAADGQPIASGSYSVYRPATGLTTLSAASFGFTREPILMKLINHFNTNAEPDPVLDWYYQMKDDSKQNNTNNRNRKQKNNYQAYKNGRAIYKIVIEGNNVKLTPSGNAGGYGSQLLERIN